MSTVPTGSTKSDLLSSMFGSGSQSYTSLVQNSNGSIDQTERLFTVRPRYTDTANVGGGDRGTKAYIKLMTTDKNGAMTRNNPVQEGFGGASLSASGGPLDAAVNGSGASPGYANFFVTSVNCSLDEKLQVTETFGDGEVAYFFGRQPIMMTISGLIFDSYDNSWFVDFISMYGHVMRGSALAQNYELLNLVLPNMSVVGSMIKLAFDQESSRDTDIRFTFSILVKQLIPTAVVASGVPTSDDSFLVNFGAGAPTFSSQADINSSKSSYAAAFGMIQDPSATTSQIAGSLTGIGSGLQAGLGSIPSFGAGGSPTNAFGFSTPAGTGSQASPTDSPANVFGSVSANLSGLRASLFSPIYGVLSSLTKLIKNASASVSSVFNALTKPVTDILRDVRNVSNQAVGVVNLLNGSIRGFAGQISNFDSQIASTFSTVKRTAGVIAGAPATVIQSLGTVFTAATFPVTTSFLTGKRPGTVSIVGGNSYSGNSSGAVLSGGSGTGTGGGGAVISGGSGTGSSGGAVLSSGTGTSSKTGAILSSGVLSASAKALLILSTPPHTPQQGAFL